MKYDQYRQFLGLKLDTIIRDPEVTEQINRSTKDEFPVILDRIFSELKKEALKKAHKWE